MWFAVFYIIAFFKSVMNVTFKRIKILGLFVWFINYYFIKKIQDISCFCFNVRFADYKVDWYTSTVYFEGGGAFNIFLLLLLYLPHWKTIGLMSSINCLFEHS